MLESDFINCTFIPYKAIIVRYRKLKESDIGDIVYISKAGHPNKYISDITAITLRTVQYWTKRFRTNDFKDIDPLYKNYSRKAGKFWRRTLAVLKREVENPLG